MNIIVNGVRIEKYYEYKDDWLYISMPVTNGIVYHREEPHYYNITINKSRLYAIINKTKQCAYLDSELYFSTDLFGNVIIRWGR